MITDSVSIFTIFVLSICSFLNFFLPPSFFSKLSWFFSLFYLLLYWWGNYIFFVLVIILEILPCAFNKVCSESVPEPSREEYKELHATLISLPSPPHTYTSLLSRPGSHPLSTPRTGHHHHLPLADLCRRCFFAIIYVFTNFFAHSFFLHF